ncbi:MAG TPA: hypothetical protein VHD55_03540 [Candidatus Paceibacterota bacterium]|nr:hypothetical protein [Candidatus Paceibacterota bacterium]
MVGDGPEAWSPRTVVRFKHGGQWYLLHYFVPKDDGFSIVLLEPLLES